MENGTMRKLLGTLACTLLLSGTTSTALASSVKLGEHTIVIQGQVNSGILPIADKLMRLASKPKVKEIDIVVNSPGGSVYAGFLFINAMEVVRNRGITIRCFVPSLAASMAFQFLVHCDKRYALPYALLLWHPVRVSGLLQLTPDKALALAKDLRMIEQEVVPPLMDALDINPKEFWYHYKEETLWTAKTLAEYTKGYIKVVEDIEGLHTLVNVRQRIRGAVDDIDGEIWYEWRDR
jgi:ATP-dependent protease ClpP protease subunit